MKKNIDDLDLSTHRPSAGSTRKLLTGEAIFLSPLPVPTGQIPLDTSGNFIEVNEVYLDLGSTNSGKAFQAQLMIANVMLVFLFFFAFTPFIAGTTAWGNPYGVSFWSRAESVLNYTFPLGIGLTTATILIALYVIIGSTLKKSKTRPVRFNRQKREVCYFPNKSDKAIIRPWEETVAWLSVSTSTTGVGIIKTHTLGIAIEDKESGHSHYINNTTPSLFHGLAQWEAVRSYMENGILHCPEKAPLEGRHTFDRKFEQLNIENKGAMAKCWWLIMHLISWWKLPYLIAEWDQRYSTKPMPDSIDEWSKAIPEEQWTAPSKELKDQSIKIQRAFAQGKNFMTYFNTNHEN